MTFFPWKIFRGDTNRDLLESKVTNKKCLSAQH